MLYKNNLRRCLFATFVLASVALAQQPVAVKHAVEVARLRAHVTHLASDKLEGRKTGTPGAEQAAEYIAAEFKRLRLAPGGNTAQARATRSSRASTCNSSPTSRASNSARATR